MNACKAHSKAACGFAVADDCFAAGFHGIAWAGTFGTSILHARLGCDPVSTCDREEKHFHSQGA